MSIAIRPFDKNRDEDYAAVAAIRNERTPDHPTTVAEMKDSDKRRDPKCKHARWIAETTGEGVGFGDYGQFSWAYHPQRFTVGVHVRSRFEGQGIGTRLYDTILAALEPYHPTELHSNVREGWERGNRFALDRGFQEEMREWESCLEVASFDPSRWETARQKPGLKDIIIRPYAELADDADRDQKLYELISQTFPDVPATIPLAPPPFERFREQFLASPNFLPDGLMIAIDTTKGRYVGSSEVSKRQSDNDLDTGLTGVLRDYRGKGIALALKLRILDFAMSLGAPIIRTENATTNAPMLAINDALGFVRQPAWIAYVLKIPENTTA
jgi:mycothiol synthase